MSKAKLISDNELLKETLISLKRQHNYCEDSWYSCPLAEDGCADDRVDKNKCNCGADEWNQRIDDVLAKVD